MKKVAIILGFITIFTLIYSYQVNQYNTVFIDESRNDRSISTDIHYPSGEGEATQFPYIIFGHGWLMNASNYQSLADSLVTHGWIVAFPGTETGFVPSHEDFALDLSFLSTAMLEEDSNEASPLYNQINPISVVMGHSMGGGSSVLAQGVSGNFSSIITFAAAETDPSAISHAELVTCPSITFIAENDNIAPPSTNQLPIYNALNSGYKAQIILNGESHLGITSNSLLTEILLPFLNYIYTEDYSFINIFENVLFNNDDQLDWGVEISNETDEELSPQANINLTIYPSPFSSNTNIRIKTNENGSDTLVKVYNIKGQEVRAIFQGYSSEKEIDLKWDGRNDEGMELPNGIYLVRVIQRNNSKVTKKIVLLK